jgi:hypothetical protein
MVSLARRSTLWRQALTAAAACHAVPIAFLVALYLIDVRHIVIGGGPPYAIADVLAESLALAAGAPPVDPWRMLGVLATLGLCTSGIALLWRAGSDLWIFFAGVLFLSPLLLLAPARPEYLNLRYFYVSIVVFLLLAAYVLGRVYRSGPLGRVAAAAMLALFIVANAWLLYGFLTIGRGHYREAVEYLAEHSPPGAIHVTSDHDFRNTMLLRYYSGALRPGQEIEYHSLLAPPAAVPQWLILHSEQHDFRPEKAVADRRGNRYRLERVFPYAGLSGFHWALYRRSQ